MDTSFLIREHFHLHILRLLAGRLAARPYAVKGGICLRFFHRSPRLSEDMDLDVAPAMPVRTLQKNVDAILSGQALSASLSFYNVKISGFSRPKQTETTQRWKVLLQLSGGARFPARLEFSRRGMGDGVERGVPGPELLKEGFLTPFVAAYYNAAAMVRQKIQALASPSRQAARDLFDLHHLFSQRVLQKSEILGGLDATTVEKALSKLSQFEFSDFREQVVPYLPSDFDLLYRRPQGFVELRDSIERRLMELLK